MENPNPVIKYDKQRNKYSIIGKKIIHLYDIYSILGHYADGVNLKKIIIDSENDFDPSSLFKLNNEMLNNLEDQIFNDCDIYGEGSTSRYYHITNYIDPLREFPFVLTIEGMYILENLVESEKGFKNRETIKWFHEGVKPDYEPNKKTLTTEQAIALYKKCIGDIKNLQAKIEYHRKSNNCNHPNIRRKIREMRDKLRKIEFELGTDFNLTHLTNELIESIKSKETEKDINSIANNRIKSIGLKKNIHGNHYETEPAIKDLNDFIRPEFQQRVMSIETKMEDKIIAWTQGTCKIECATFCELLFFKKYFNKGATRIKTVNSFACFRYGVDITIQLQAAKKRGRMPHIKLLNKYFI